MAKSFVRPSFLGTTVLVFLAIAALLCAGCVSRENGDEPKATPKQRVCLIRPRS